MLLYDLRFRFIRWEDLTRTLRTSETHYLKQVLQTVNESLNLQHVSRWELGTLGSSVCDKSHDSGLNYIVKDAESYYTPESQVLDISQHEWMESDLLPTIFDASKTTVEYLANEIQLDVGQTLCYSVLLESGVEWDFEVTVENIESGDSGPEKPNVIRESGGSLATEMPYSLFDQL